VFLGASIALFVVAYSLGSREFQLGAALLAVLVVAAIVFVRIRRLRVSATRTFAPAIIAAGSTATVTVDVRNLALSRTVAAHWRDRLPWAPWSSDPGDLPSLAPAGIRFAQRGNTTSLRYTMRPPQRGIYEVGPLLVSYGDPFGIVEGESAIAGVQTVVVTPELVELSDAGLGFAAGEGTARLVQRSMAGNEDDLMTREYRRGDALRRVHWRASARYGELMVRQEEQRARPEVRLVIDTRRTGYSDAVETPPDSRESESETFEWVVRMTASLGVHLHRSGYHVTVLETAEAQVAGFGDASQWAAQDEAFLTSLAGIRLVDVRVRDRVGPAEQTQQGGALFAVLAEPDTPSLDWLLRQRKPGERGVAFVPVWSRSARDALINAGWQCVVFQPGDDLAMVWAAVGTFAGKA
jgi:uncharacterized protein (DUF58 family)